MNPARYRLLTEWVGYDDGQQQASPPPSTTVPGTVYECPRGNPGWSGKLTVGGTLLTERVDRFVLHGKQVAIPVMGAFEVGPDGKIRAWRDYFDLQQFTKQMPGSPS